MIGCDGIRLRAFFLVGYNIAKTVFMIGCILSLAARLLLVVVENLPKRFILLNPTSQMAFSAEAMATPLSRWFMLWLLPLLRKGYKNPNLSLNDLGEAPQDSAAVYARFEKAWLKHRHQKLPMARSLCSAFSGELIAPLVSVLLWCLLLMSVPLELAGLLKFLK